VEAGAREAARRRQADVGGQLDGARFARGRFETREHRGREALCPYCGAVYSISLWSAGCSCPNAANWSPCIATSVNPRARRPAKAPISSTAEAYAVHAAAS
jgi:hypothetical protein